MIKKIRIIITALGCFFGITLFFINSSIMTNFLGNFLHVDYSYTGGIVAGDFVDFIGDDDGAGNLRYPTNKSFEEGALDLVRYTVHQPVTNARWQNSADYWQLDIEYKNGPAFVRNIMIYIGIDNIEGGSTESLYENAEKLCFDEKHPWNYAVWLHGEKGTVYNSDGELLGETETSIMNDDKLIKLRIPLKNKELLKILGATKSYHYVVTGAESQFDRGGFMPVEKRAGLSHGGVKTTKDYNTLLPNVYDILGENEALSTWDSETFEKARISPVEVQMEGVLNNKKNTKEIEAYIQKVKDIYAQSGMSSNISGDLESNLALYKTKIEENPDDYVSLAYYGSLLAMKGGQSNVMKAVALVNESYTYLDKAAELAEGKEGEIEVLMNRASVSASVPEQVFGKAESGAEDFMKIISIADDVNLKAYCYVMAYECYTSCGKDSQAFLALQEAKKMIK